MMPPDVADVTARFLDLLDARLPGQVSGLYLVGSVALDDYRPGHSDVDFVAVTEGEPDVAALQAVHDELCPPMAVDGVYVSDLRAGLGGEHPYAFEGRVTVGEAFEANPAVWQTLAQCPVIVRGPVPQVATDRDALVAWTRENLRTYWTTVRDGVAGATPEQVNDWLVVWAALGPARLVYTLETGLVTSKRGAGEWAGDTPILREALRLRAGGASEYDPVERHRDLVTHMDALLGRASVRSST